MVKLCSGQESGRRVQTNPSCILFLRGPAENLHQEEAMLTTPPQPRLPSSERMFLFKLLPIPAEENGSIILKVVGKVMTAHAAAHAQ